MSEGPGVPQSVPASVHSRLLPVGVNAVGAAAAVLIAVLLAGAFISGRIELAAVLLSFAALLLLLAADPAKGLLLWVLMAPFFRFFILKMGSGMPDLGLHRITALFLLLLFFAQWVAGRGRVRLTVIDGAAGLFVLGLLLSVPASHMGISGGIQYVFDFAALPVLWFFFGRVLLGNKEGLDRLSIVLAIAGAAMGLIAAREQLTLQMVLSPSATQQAYGLNSIKISSLFGVVAIMSMTLVVTLPAAFVGAIRARTPGRRLAWGAALAAILVGLALTYVRAGWVAALLCLIVPLFFSPRVRRYALRLAPAVLILAVIFTYGFGGVDTRAFEDRIQSQNPIDYRLEALAGWAADRRTVPCVWVRIG